MLSLSIVMALMEGVQGDHYDQSKQERWSYEAPQANSQRRYEGIEMNFLFPDFIAHGLDGTGTFFVDRIRAFCDETGAKATMTHKAFPAAYRDELEYDLQSGLNFYDAFNFFGSWMPGLVANGNHLLKLTDYVKQSPELAWSDVLPAVRRGVCEFQKEIYMLPADGDVIVMIFRKDLLDLHGLATPETWEDWLAVSKYFRENVGTDAWTDSPNRTLQQEGGAGACMMTKLGDWAYANLFAFLSTFMQAHGPSQGIFFDPVTMEPLFNTSAAREALVLYKQLVLESTHADRPCDTCTDDGGAGLFTMVEDMQAGKCMMGFNYMGPIKFIASGSFNNMNSTIALAPVPGSTRVRSLNGDGLVDCAERESNCPFADVVLKNVNGRSTSSGETQRVNRATYYSGGGQSWAISSHVQSQQKRQALWDFLKGLIDKNSSILSTTAADYLLDPFRQSTLDGLQVEGHLATVKFMENGWKWQQLGTMKDTLSTVFTDENSVLDLKIVEGGQYIEETDSIMLEYFKGELTVDEAIQKVTELWKARTNTLGRNEQRNIYRGVLGLAPYFEKPNCLAGSYAFEGSCALCASGRFTAEPGAGECTQCPTGMYNSMSGQTICTQCGATTRSMKNYVTMQRMLVRGIEQWVPISGATDESDCGCMATTMPETEGSEECVPCGEGLDCRGKDDVWVLEGYSSEKIISVYRCYGDQRRCKGGRPGHTCSSGRTGRSCFECEDGYAAEDDGTCSKCGGRDVAPFLLVCIIAFLSLCLIYYVIDTQDQSKQNHSVLWGALTISVSITIAQQLGVVNALSLSFPEPLKSVLNVAAFMTFNLEIIRVDCVSPTTPLSRFLIKALVIVVVSLAVLFIHALSVTVRHKGRFAERTPTLIANIGTIFTVFYISVVSTVLGPMQCVNNPNEKMTIQAYQSTICWEGGDHLIMVIIGASALLMPIAFLMWCAWAVLRFPRMMRDGEQVLFFLRSYAFLFFRYRADVYWYPLVHLSRSLLIALAPVFPNVAAQVLIVQLVLSAQLCLLVQIKPWRIDHINFLETAFTIAMLVILSVTGLLVSEVDPEPLAVIAAVIIGVVFLMVPLFVGLAVCRWWQQKSNKPFMFFICHAKVAAGSLARLLKMHLTESPRMTKKTFIDSDDLRDLDRLFDYVGSQTDTLVILMSKDIFTRPWCLGEMVTGKAKQVNAAPIALADFTPPSDEFLGNFESYVPGILALGTYGIDVPMVCYAIRWVLAQKIYTLPSILTQSDLRSLSDALTCGDVWEEGGRTSGSRTSAPSRQITSGKTLGILVDLAHQGTLCTGLVLAKILFKHIVHQDVNAPTVLYKDTPLESLQTVLILCANGTFHSAQVLEQLLCIGQLATVKHIPILTDESFRFPTQESIDQCKPAAASVHDDPEGLLQLVISVFHSIALVFQPDHYGSTEAVLEAKAVELAQQLKARAILHTLVYKRKNAVYNDPQPKCTDFVI